MAPNWAFPAGLLVSRKTAARVVLGAICLSSSSHFPLRLYSNSKNPVVLPLGRARLSTKPLPTGSMTFTNTIGTVRVACCNAARAGLLEARMASGASAASSRVSEFRRRWSWPSGCQSARFGRWSNPIAAGPPKCPDASLKFRIVCCCRQEHADAPYRLLRPCDKRPRSRRAAEQRDELAPPHSITSSARASSVGGTSRPRALAVLRLMASSNFVGCWTGRSAGLAPLRIRSMYDAARR